MNRAEIVPARQTVTGADDIDGQAISLKGGRLPVNDVNDGHIHGGAFVMNVDIVSWSGPLGPTFRLGIVMHLCDPVRARAAEHFWKQGADGIYLFNFFCPREAFAEPPFEVLSELGDRQKLQATR